LAPGADAQRNYNDPGSYSQSWGGPSLAGVFAVHSAPELAVLIAAAVLTRRRTKGRRPVTGEATAPGEHECGCR
jgi:hypothetical protein